MAETGIDIQKAKEILERGELVAIPTETVYGLAGNALNADAVIKIFKAKNRPQFDPLIVHIADINQADAYVEEFPEKAKTLAAAFWPGPLTLLLKRKITIPDLVTSGLDTVGMRCPNHPLTLALLRSLSFPLAAPSANPFGYISPTAAYHVNEQLGDKIEYILDGGECAIGLESTIIGFETDTPTIYRLGGLSIDKIEAHIGKVNVALNVSSNPMAPGQLKSHYAPRKKMYIGDLNELVKKFSGKKIGILAFQKPVKGCDLKNQIILSPTANTEEAAKRLFAAMRELDKMDIDLIVAEKVPSRGLGIAINDRLQRATA
jgi:L-threonylcarbamoyladenylate synthase